MPRRPPKEWFDRCVADVAAGGYAVNPAAVCGATWRDKTPADKAFAIALEDDMPKKKHGKHKTKKTPKHGQHRTSRAGPKRGKARTKSHRSAARTAHNKDVHQHKCPACGHLERHDPKAGCTHFDGHRFCPCKHRHR
jgi:hypothetical protein